MALLLRVGRRTLLIVPHVASCGLRTTLHDRAPRQEASVLVLLGGMTAFFLLAFLLSGMLGEGERVRRFMLVMTGVFGILTALLVLSAGG
jgi:hypothetical protein